MANEKEREELIASLSTLDKKRFKQLETDYEIEKEIGSPVPDDKLQYIKNRIDGKRYTRGI